MAVKVLVVNDHAKMGDLIKDISYGNVPEPTSIDDLDTLLITRGIVTNTPPGSHWRNGKPSGIKIVKIPYDDLMMFIPSKSSIEDGAKLALQLSTDGSYPFPNGYDLNYVDGTRKSPTPPPDWETIYRTRLGDYTIGKCM